MPTFVLPLADQHATLEAVGGKGMSLAKMSRAGLPVPNGFYVTTEAFRCFIEENQIQPHILAPLQGVDSTDPATLEHICQQITAYFNGGTIPPKISAAIVAAYSGISSTTDGATVAVRSSATAEDLPGMSFAGQQETYLNICGVEAVLEAVRKCWAGLWTARAIGYRVRQNIASESVALAVIVQVLVPAEAAGVLFTANPLNGRRDEIVVNAARGLGEAIVGGVVTPDTITVDRLKSRVIRREITPKQVMTVRTKTGTEEQPVPDYMKNKAALSDHQAAELARYGSQIEDLYGMPMDIEWAIDNDRISILQARPITRLPDPPLEWKVPYPKPLLIRGSTTDLISDAVSPLFTTLGIPIVTKAYFKMHPGDILVAVATTPAWTPLFAMASAVVADMGGTLSHSSIVAREYGIPAVMATGIATRCILTGQVITVDGSAGTVLLR